MSDTQAHATSPLPRPAPVPRRQRSAALALALRRLPLLAGLPASAAVLLSGHEVALLLGTTPDAVRRHARKGLIPAPAVVVERQRRWRRAEILAWIDARRDFDTTGRAAIAETERAA